LTGGDFEVLLLDELKGAVPDDDDDDDEDDEDPDEDEEHE
jgi:hypothetical protein